MTSPAVTELPRRLEPVSRDTFVDELAVPRSLRPSGDLAPFGSVVAVAEQGRSWVGRAGS